MIRSINAGKRLFHPPLRRETHEKCGSFLNSRSDLDHLSPPSRGRVRDDSKWNCRTESIRNSGLWLDCWDTAQLESTTRGEHGDRRSVSSPDMHLLHVSVVVMLDIKTHPLESFHPSLHLTSQDRAVSWKLWYPSRCGEYLKNKIKMKFKSLVSDKSQIYLNSNNPVFKK